MISPNFKITPHFHIHPYVAQSLRANLAVLALESAVITHGLPHPENLELAQRLEDEVRSKHVSPATVAVLHGKVHIGLTQAELVELANPATLARKISRRDFGIAIAKKENGGTTVAGTLFAASSVGIRVFATGGIGGVHRDAPFDVSADLNELGHTPMIVICAGPKAILDIPATMEVLETMGVPVLGYQTDELPAFYSRESGQAVTQRVDSAEEVVSIAQAQWQVGLQSAVLVVVPPPESVALPPEEINALIVQALEQAKSDHVSGAAMTPYLLKRVGELSQRNSLAANIALLENNARVAADIALEWVKRYRPTD